MGITLEKRDLEKLREFWEDEVISAKIYTSLAKKAKKDKKEVFEALAKMEEGHANLWSSIAKRFFGVTFKVGIKLKLKVFFYKLLARLMPLTFMLNYLELGERSATIEYARFLEKFKEDPDLYEAVRKVIYDEIEHEITFTEMLIGEKSYIGKIKDAIYGMTDSLVEILALVIGLAGVMTNPLTIGLAGFISTIGGTFSMTTGAYLSVKSQNEVYEGKKQEIDARELVAIDTLVETLAVELEERGVERETAKQIAEMLKERPKALKSLVTTLTIEESPADPGEAAKTTGIYYVLGALPAILPFFIGHLLGTPTILIAIIAVGIASITAFIAGILTAVLSGVSVLKKATLNVLMIIGAALATYAIGTLARVLLHIEI